MTIQDEQAVAFIAPVCQHRGHLMEPTYKLIGNDGNEYGPITAAQFQTWVQEGRVTAATKVLRSTDAN